MRQCFALERYLIFLGDSQNGFAESLAFETDFWRELACLLTYSIFLVQTSETSPGSFSIGFHSLNGFFGMLTGFFHWTSWMGKTVRKQIAIRPTVPSDLD